MRCFSIDLARILSTATVACWKGRVRRRGFVKASLRGWCVGVGMLVALCSWSGVGRAEPTGDERALATELFRQGRALMAQKKFDQACAKLAESQRLDPGGGTLLNLALCHEQQGRTATAWTELHEARGQARADGRSDRLALANEHIEALSPRLCRLKIVVPSRSRIDGLAIRRNGAQLGRAAWGVAMPVDPGAQRINMTAPGHTPWQQTVTVTKEGATVTVRVPMLEPISAPEPTPQSVTPSPLPTLPATHPRMPTRTTDDGWLAGQVAGVVLAGLSVASFGVALGAGIVALDKKAASDDACSLRCDAHAVALYEDGKTAADVSTFWLGTGIVMAATSVYLLVTSWGDGAGGDSAVIRW